MGNKCKNKHKKQTVLLSAYAVQEACFIKSAHSWHQKQATQKKYKNKNKYKATI